ncbi:putative RNA-binding protein with RPS1 domain [Mycoplasma testudineum]|uniref:Putative RNA-binding protein with RPS1 domain n=1 Tax=Mycoplasma testudineum TaxID=244584 RepID=A0A4R6IB82_9MOLU|nr:S1 RNA-binding domain-containing protein [Mycoplasma testudineum]OYD26627.1 hypothetical protein CG473_03265 [Mycoplasma testudineum]TDO19463.1 putative RNA-binding protein with RPS1 domain [Mycoplasma testudineum]
MEIGSIHKARIVTINEKGILLELTNGWSGIVSNSIKIEALSANILRYLRIGEFIDVKITKILNNNRFLASFKAIRPNLMSPRSKYELKPTSGGFWKLKEQADKDIKKWAKSN